jgi:zinc transport system permease protein
MIGDGLAHTSFGGIALGIFLGVYPLFTAVVIAILSVLGISYLRRKGIAPSDSAIAVFLALGFSTGLILISLSNRFNVDLFSYLFGSILTIDKTDLLVVCTLSVCSLIFISVFYKELLAITFDEESSRLSGIPVSTLTLVFDILVAVTIVLTIRVVGVILVAALIVLPGLSALQFNLSFRGTTALSVIMAVISVLSGIILSAIYNVATSGLIVFVAAGIFLFSAMYKRLGE